MGKEREEKSARVGVEVGAAKWQHKSQPPQQTEGEGKTNPVLLSCCCLSSEPLASHASSPQSQQQKKLKKNAGQREERQPSKIEVEDSGMVLRSMNSDLDTPMILIVPYLLLSFWILINSVLRVIRILINSVRDQHRYTLKKNNLT